MAEKKTNVKAVEKSALEEFYALDGASLLYPPPALTPSKVMRLMGLMAHAQDVEQEDTGAFMEMAADIYDWVAVHATVSRPKFDAFFEGRPMEAIEFCMTYAGAVGELLDSGN